ETPMVREPVADDPSRRGASAARRAQDALRALGKAASGRSATPAPRVNAPASNPPAREPVAGDGGPEELILINVLAPREQPFTGTQLIDALRANGLRYGEMNIFHRIDAERRVIQFSIANIIEPGTFDLADIDAFRSPGLCFFLRLPGPESPIDAFDDMQRTARDVAQRLAGELKDERRSVLTAQTIEHYRGRVAEYCRRRMSIRA
ncbi:MAG: cell division protein ZipA, partial [Gammaproteobacteria bacterium]